MIIAIDTNSILPGQVGGIENYTIGLIEALQLPQSPASQLVLLTRPENDERFRPFANHNTLVVLQQRSKHSWSDQSDTLVRFQLQKKMLLHKHGVDLLHCPGNTINPIGIDLPVVLNLHDLQHRHFPEYFSNAELANREKWWVASAQRADSMIASSNYVRNDLNDQLGLSRSKIFVMPDLFESAFMQQPPKALTLAKLRYRLQLPEKFFIYPAAVWPHKNHDRLIRAFNDAKLPDAQLILTGGGQEKLAAFASPNVRLFGRIETADLIGLYHLATAMLFPSQHESWSIPIMEAMACGCPLAASAITSLPEEIGDAGLLFEPNDQTAMTSIFRQFAADDALRNRLATAGKLRVKQFSPESCLPILTAAYDHARRNFYLRKAA